jgi:citrate synthase
MDLERTASAQLARKNPDRPLNTNAEFWSMVVLGSAGIPAELVSSLLACARMAGWSAHILEQKRQDKLIRPMSAYLGHPPRKLEEVAGFRPIDN